MIIRKASISDIPAIRRLANEIWWPAYKNILSAAQISFMLEDLYSETALKDQMQQNYHFLIAERKNIPVGFAAYSLSDAENKVYKLQKLYILPTEQGKGSGKKLVDEVSFLAAEQDGEILELNVNRENSAFNFYIKLGFEIYQEVDIPYHDFVLNDYVMRRKIVI